MSDGELLPRDKATRLREFEHCVGLVRSGVIGVARALDEIRSKRLYIDAGHKTFAECCSAQFGYSPSTVARLTATLPILAALQKMPMGQPQEVSALRERHMRPLRKMARVRGPHAAAVVLAKAIEAAPRDVAGRPQVTEQLVADAARASGWKTDAEFKAEARGVQPRQRELCDEHERNLPPAGGSAPSLESLLELLRHVVAVDWPGAVDSYGLLLINPQFAAAEQALAAARARQHERADAVSRRAAAFGFTRPDDDDGEWKNVDGSELPP